MKCNRAIVGCVLVALVPFLALLPLRGPLPAHAASPSKIVYQGFLYGSNGRPLTTPHVARFSYWSSGDFLSTDILPSGQINTAAPAYLGWQEVHTFTPRSDGRFTVDLGTIAGLLDYSALTPLQIANLHLQVEIKTVSDPVTSFEILDRNPSDATDDRSPVRSVPYALNADKVDGRSIGSGSGAIPLLGSGGLLAPRHVPGGTQRGAFTIDVDDTESGDIELRFGTALGKVLSYDLQNTRFSFNDDVRIEGNLTVTGFVNGVDLSSLTPASDRLRVQAGDGLSANISGGDYRLRGTVVQFAGDADVALQDNATNYVFFAQSGLAVNTSGFPSAQSYIPLATVTTSAGDITGVSDRRIVSSDDRERTVERVFEPMYEGSTLVPTSSGSVGLLSLQHATGSLVNAYAWTTTRSTLQSYEVRLKVALPSGFAGWDPDTPMTVRYRTSSASPTESKVRVAVADTAGNPVLLSGALQNLASTAWVTATADFLGNPAWTPGESLLITLRLSAREGAVAQIAAITLRYREITMP